MRLMNEILKPFLGKFVVVYLDDILMYSRCVEDHLVHLRQVFETLRAQQLYGKMEKCTFLVDSIIFLGYVVSKDGVAVDQGKIEAIRSWPAPKPKRQRTEVRSFAPLALEKGVNFRFRGRFFFRGEVVSGTISWFTTNALE